MINNEEEVKIRIPQNVYERLIRLPASAPTEQQLNIYYDTQKMNLYDKKHPDTLRIRYRSGEWPIAQLKVNRGVSESIHRRIEYTTEQPLFLPPRSLDNLIFPLEPIAMNRKSYNHEASVALLRSIGLSNIPGARLVRLGGARTTRHAICTHGGYEIEVDKVILPSGDMYFEVEQEDSYKQDVDGLYDEILTYYSGKTFGGLERPSFAQKSKYETFVESCIFNK